MGAGNNVPAREETSSRPNQHSCRTLRKNGLASKHDPRMNVMRQNEQQKKSLSEWSYRIRATTSRPSGDVEGGIASLRGCLIQLLN
jgi:hypothetical protein